MDVIQVILLLIGSFCFGYAFSNLITDGSNIKNLILMLIGILLALFAIMFG